MHDYNEFEILLALRDELQNDLSDHLAEALNFADANREISNNVACRFAAQFAAQLAAEADADGETITVADCLAFIDEIYPTLYHQFGHTDQDAAAIQAYLLTIFGLDPLYLDLTDEDLLGD